MDTPNDVLGHEDPARAVGVADTVLGETEDPQLKEFARLAATALGAPSGLVTVVLERTLLFRAQFGVSGSAAAAAAIDRDLSCCQYVVRDKTMVEVNDADTDPRIPHEVVTSLGLRAYLGAPVSQGATVVGTLCVFDKVPRQFTTAERRALATLAMGVGLRFAELTLVRVAERARALAGEPLVCELRNVLQPLDPLVARGKVATADLMALARMAMVSTDEGCAAIRKSMAAIQDLQRVFEHLEHISDRLRAQSVAVEQLFAQEPHTAAHVFDAAARLAHHHLKLIGGAHWHPSATEVPVRAPLGVLVPIVAAVTSRLALLAAQRRLPGGLHASAREERCVTILDLAVPGLRPPDLSALEHQATLLRGDPRVQIGVTAAGARITVTGL
jgi:hypothetical protein